MITATCRLDYIQVTCDDCGHVITRLAWGGGIDLPAWCDELRGEGWDLDADGDFDYCPRCRALGEET